MYMLFKINISAKFIHYKYSPVQNIIHIIIQNTLESYISELFLKIPI